MPVSVTPIHKTIYIPISPVKVSLFSKQRNSYFNTSWKTEKMVEDEDEAGPSWRCKVEESDESVKMEAITVWSQSTSELWDMWKILSCHPGKHIVNWLIHCWNNGTSSLDLVGSEARQEESLSGERGHWQSNWKKDTNLHPIEMTLVSPSGKIRYIRKASVMSWRKVFSNWGN